MGINLDSSAIYRPCDSGWRLNPHTFHWAEKIAGIASYLRVILQRNRQRIRVYAHGQIDHVPPQNKLAKSSKHIKASLRCTYLTRRIGSISTLIANVIAT